MTFSGIARSRRVAFLLGLFCSLAAFSQDADFSVADSTVTVTSTASTTLNFPVTRSGDTSYPAQLQFQTSNGTALAGTDYTATSGSLNLATGVTTATIPVTVAGRSNNPADKSFSLLLSTTSFGPTADFAAKADIPAGSDARAMVLGDFDNDGNDDDLAVSRNGETGVLVLSNTSAGDAALSFSAQTLPTPETSLSIARGDFNADSRDDLVVSFINSDQVAVLLNGASAFGSNQNFGTGDGPTAVTTGDFNRDGKDDIAAANGTANTVSVLLSTTGSGNPSFSAQQSFGVGTLPSAVIAADFNQDGRLDLATANRNSNNISVLLNTAASGASTPSFSAAQNLSVGTAPRGLVAADLNRDGKLDLAVSNADSNNLSLLRNTAADGAGTPSFAAAQTLNTAVTPLGLSSGDLNRDGVPDLLFAALGANQMVLLPGTTAANATTLSFGSAQPFTTANGPGMPVSADFNNDGRRDAAVVTNSGLVSLLRSTQSRANVNASAIGTISYNVPAPRVQLSAASLAFGSVVNGQTSASQTVTVSNTGSQTLTLGTPALGGSQAADFAITATTCGATIASTGSCTLTLSFTPSATGARNASLSIPSDAASSPDVVTLSGTGEAGLGQVTPNPANVSFGAQPVGSLSGSSSVSLRNSGNVPISITGFTAGGSHPVDFALATETCTGRVLAVNDTCSASFTFTPSRAGTRGASQTVGTDRSGVTASIALSGTGSGPELSAAPASLAFGGIRSGESSTARTLTLTNSGTSTLSISDVSSGSAEFPLTHNCPAVLAANASCQAQIRFAPAARGSRSGTVSILSSAPSSPDSISVSGTGTQSAASLSPSPLAFGSVRLGDTAQLDLGVRNIGDAPLNLGPPALSGSATADYTLSGSSCGTAVAAGASCVLSYTFTPAALGDRLVSLSLPSDDPASPATVNFTGKGVRITAAYSASSFAFGSQAIGGSSTTQNLSITNTGNETLRISQVSFSGGNAADFGIDGNGCTVPVAGGASCVIGLRFVPRATGARSAAFNITSNAEGSPVSLPLSGTGIQARFSASPSPLAFGSLSVGANAMLTLSISNPGDDALQLETPSLGGNHPADFSIVNNGCTSSVAANGSCAVTLRFTPPVKGGRNAVLRFASNAPGSPNSVNLSGVGIQAVLSLSPQSLNFGAQSVGSTAPVRSITLSNTGNDDLEFPSAASFSGAAAADYALSSDGCFGTTVAAGASCSLSISFTPGATGSRAAALLIPSNAQGGTASLSLAGSGVQAALSVTPASLAFGDQALDTAATRTLRISNSGSEALSLGTPALTGTSEFSISSNGCRAAIAPGAGCNLVMRFATATAGAKAGSLSLPSNDPSSPATVALSGTGVQPQLSLTPASLAFGDRAVGAAPTSLSLSLSNSGSAPLEIGNPELDGTQAGDFSITGNTCTSTRAPGQSCAIGISFSPAAMGARGATLLIPTNVAEAPQQVSLGGNGIAGTPVSVSLSAAPAQVQVEDETLLTWSSTNAVNCTASGAWSGSRAVSGTETLRFSSTGARKLMLTCFSAQDVTATASADLQVVEREPAALLFTGEPLQLSVPGDVQLDWNSNMTGCTASSNQPGLSWTGARGAAGTEAVRLSNPGTVRLTLVCRAGSASITRSLDITAKPRATEVSTTDPQGREVKASLPAGQAGSLQEIEPVATPVTAPSGFSYPVGFYSFRLTGLATGATATVELSLPDGVVPNEYIKCIASVCAPFAGAAFNGSIVTLTLVDGGAGDADRVANGTIVDPGAPAIRTRAASVSDDDGGGATGSGALALLLLGSLLRRRKQG